MKKIFSTILFIVLTLVACGQSVSKSDITIQKAAPVLHLNGTSAAINFYNSDIVLQQSSNQLTLSGGNFSLGANSLFGTGSIGLTGSRLTKGWFTDLEITNLPTINGATLASALSLSGYLLKTDTAAMLTNYALLSEASLGEVLYSDSTVVFATPTQISDTLIQRISTATVGVAAQDSNVYAGYTTRTYVESLLGSGSGLSAQTLPFIIGVTTGAPAAGDSTVAHTEFEGKHIDVYRSLNTITGGAKQFQNFTATNTVDGFRLNSSTVTVNPVWVDGEQVLIDIIEPILWSYISLTGQESSLLDSLNGYWKFDETSGTAVVDATGTQNGTTNATPNVASLAGLGRARDFDAANDVVNIAYNANIVPSGADFSVAMWFKMDTLASVMGHDEYLFQQNIGAAPYSAHYMYINDANDGILCTSRNTDGTQYTVQTSSTLSVDTWYHVVFVNRGDGQTLQVYLNGSDVSASAGTFSGTLAVAAGTTCFGNSYSGAVNYLEGIIDSPGIWNRALTSGEVTTLYNAGNGKTHPFN